MKTIAVKINEDPKIYGIVRGADGKVKVDGNPADLHPSIIAMLSSAEREELGLWPGPIAQDAQGLKRLEKNEETLVALDALVAASWFWVDGVCYRAVERTDVPTGGTLKLKES